MTLPSSGAITLNDVNIELGRSSGASINLNDTDVRALSGVPSGQISMSNLHGKSWYGQSRGVYTVTTAAFYQYFGYTQGISGAINSIAYRSQTIKDVLSDPYALTADPHFYILLSGNTAGIPDLLTAVKFLTGNYMGVTWPCNSSYYQSSASATHYEFGQGFPFGPWLASGETHQIELFGK